MARRLILGLALVALATGCNRNGANDAIGTRPVTVEVPISANGEGVTPMAQRVAVIGLLNKRNGIVTDLTLRPGQAVRVKDAIVISSPPHRFSL